MEKLLLIDGNSLLFRAYYATMSQRMTTKDGLYTNAVYGFNNMLTKALDLINPSHALVAFDTGKKTFRHDLFSEYKGTRREVDPQLVMQFPLVRELLDHFPITRIEKEGYEADDLIGTLAKSTPNMEVIILTSDRDMLQLVDQNVSVCLMKKGITEMQIVTIQNIKQEYSVLPWQVIELKALMGDSADNIPGIKGIGEKSAIKLLEEYQSIDNLYQHTDQLKGKLQEKIVNGKESAYLSKTLATINTKVELDLNIKQALLHIDYNLLSSFYRKYEMNSLLKKIETNFEQSESQNFEFADVSESFLNDNVTVAPVVDSGIGFNVKISHFIIADDKKVWVLSETEALNNKQFIQLCEGNFTKRMIDGKSLCHWFYRNDIKFDSFVDDLLISAYLVDSNITTLDKLKDKYHLWSDGRTHFDDTVVLAKTSFELINQFRNEMIQMDVIDLYEDVEIPLVPILVEMERVGLLVDKQQLIMISDEIKLKLDALTTSIYQFAETEFNINSPKQLAEVLFDKLNLTPNKKRSTSVEVLEKLESEHPIISLILKYRKYQKFYGTYAEGLQKYITEDSRIHSTFNQTAAQTGRLSSVDPNLQNISVRDEETRIIRKVFIADKGYSLLSADYSQIELRVLASMANVKSMVNAYQNGIDIHTLTASEVFGVAIDQVSSTMRRNAKAVNFGIVYGISDFGLAQQLDIPVFEAKDFIESYYEKFGEIKAYMNGVVDFCEQHGYVKTAFNRRRVIEEIHDKNYMLRQRAKRMAMNAPIQGTAADIIKFAMVKVSDQLKKLKLQSKLVLQVHDELLLLVKNDELNQVSELVVNCMKNAVKLTVEMDCSCDIGQNWYDI